MNDQIKNESAVRVGETVADTIMRVAEGIPELIELVKARRSGFVVIGTEDNGEDIYLVRNYRDDHVADARGYIEAGTRIAEHSHPEVEFLIVCTGEMHLVVNRKKVILGPAGCFRIPANVAHHAHWPVRTKLLAITIPPAEAYP